MKAKTAPTGWTWSAKQLNMWGDDPYLNFNLIDWFNKVTYFTVGVLKISFLHPIATSGNYIKTIDLFKNYHEEMMAVARPDNAQDAEDAKEIKDEKEEILPE
jgi:hypothetical protein